MRSILRFPMAVLVLLASALPSSAYAPLKGKWTFTLLPEGQVMVITGLRFQAKGVGRTPRSPVVSGGIAYRETETDFSATWEFKTIIHATGSFGTSTLVLRGTKTSDTTVEGQLLIITDHPDPTSPTGYETIRGIFTGVRDAGGPPN